MAGWLVSFGLVTALIGSSASADILVRFGESAPKDRFTITNEGPCSTGPIDLEIDLSTSQSGLIFDVTDQGAGVQVFQPFELTAGQNLLTSLPTVTDGQSAIQLNITQLDPGASIAFTIDVDDTTGNREITVNGAEIKNATVRAGETSAAFDESATARVPFSGCSS